MILLTKLDNKKVLVNLENVKCVEMVPDTLIFFTNGESLIVRESLEELTDSVVKFKSLILKRAESAIMS